MTLIKKIGAIRLNQQPIFIVGFPRSGTTFLQTLISTQDVITFPETHFFTRLVPQLAFKNEFLNINSANLNIVVKHLKVKLNVELTQEEIKDLHDYFRVAEVDEKKLLETLIKIFLLKNEIPYSENQIWMEKTPGHAKYIKNILKLYPSSKFISIIRSPYASIPSVVKKLSMMSDNPYMLSSNWGALYRKILFAMEAYGAKIYFVKYESLLKEKVKYVEKIMSFLGLPFHANKLELFAEKADLLVTPIESWKQNNSASNFTNSESHEHSTVIQFPNEDILQKFDYQIVQLSKSAKTKLQVSFQFNKISYRLKRWFKRTISQA